MTVTGELAAWSAALRPGDVPPAVRVAARRHLLDGTGVALAAARAGAAGPAVAVARGLGGPPERVPLAGGPALGAPAAALADGALVHALDFDDTHAEGLVHATAVVLPAAFAVGAELRARGEDVLVAAVVGYEVLCRLAAASPHGFHARGLHATSVCGTLAAAAVTARLHGMDAATTAAALGIAASSSGGLLEFLATGASTKQLHPGLAAMAGIVAARLAAAGAEGPASAVEGERGLYAALSARPADPARVTRTLGETWETTRMTIKPYPACQLMHAALDAAAAVREPLDGALGEIEHVDVEVHPDSAAVVAEPEEDKRTPRTAYDAKFSLPWSVAAMLLDGEVTVSTYAPQQLARADVAALARRVRTTPAASALPAADAPARVAVTPRGGAPVVAEVARSAGGPALPLTDEALLAKYTAGVGGPSPAAAELAERLLALEGEPSLDAVTALATQLAGGTA